MMARPAAGMPKILVKAAMEPPQRFLLLGRNAQSENSDINGEYSLVSDHLGFPAYLNRTSGIAIRFQPGRWLIDRAGIRDSDVCVGYALSLPHCVHPACPDLVWHVWDSRAQSHVEDTKVVAIDAPKEAIFTGRATEQENSVVGGKFTLATTAHGRGLYQHQTEDIIIYYRAQEDRWLLSGSQDLGSDLCIAWAKAGTALHPVDGSLQWNFWEPDANNFVLDQRVGLVDAPRVINMFGRHPQAENSRINGEYQLCGVWAGKPLYHQPGVGVIKYSPKKDWWLIDCDGLAQPGLMTRLMTFVTGDADSAFDRCNAWANAHGSAHPGHCSLQWFFWDTVGQSHHPDKSVVSTRAPVRVQVSGRDARLENADINGEYSLTTFYEDRPVYEKAGTQVMEPISMYFSRHTNTWVIDRNGLTDSGVCVAYMDGQIASDDPTVNSAWKVYEASRNFVLDTRMSVTALCDVPAGYVPNDNQIDTFMGAVPSANAACHGLKRGYGVDAFASLAQSPQSKQARGPNQGGGWLRDTSRRVFGA